MKNKILLLATAVFAGAFPSDCINAEEKGAFPYILPSEKPTDISLSAAVERNYDNYPTARPDQNELFSVFKYTRLKGFDYNNFDGTISRRDPSKVIFQQGKYYVWYTHRHTDTPVMGPENATDTIPARDWDLSEVWYATSKDGFTWEEQGVAIPRAEFPNPGWRSVTTADILEWKGKFYMYYQAFSIHPKIEGDFVQVAVSVADSPDGPWKASNRVVLPKGPSGTWDSGTIHDPYPLVRDGKIYLYYKSNFNVKGLDKVRMQGLAIADNPLGPFEKHPLNPVLNSGHETTLFPFREGVAAFQIRDGNEHFTIQWSPDGVNFEVAAITEMMPFAAGPFVPDAFTDTKNGRGITWGICHNLKANPVNSLATIPKGSEWASILMRFDCDLSLDIHDPEMKKASNYFPPEVYYKMALSEEQRKRIAVENKSLR